MRHASILLVAASALLVPRFGLALEANEVFKRADPSVVVIVAEGPRRGDGMQGSGVITEPLDVVTNCHVVATAVKITVKQGSVQRSAKLRYQDAARDLCQIRLDDAFPSGRPVSGYVDSKDLEVGQAVFAIGSPRGLEHTISRGIVSALREMKEEVGSLIQTDAAVSPGSSGGGLFDAEARLIGIMSRQVAEGQNLNFAIPADWIRELTTRNRDRLTESSKSNSVQRGDEKAAADATAAGVPRIGDRWKYKLIDGKQAVGNVIVEIVDTRGKMMTERITREGQKGFVSERSLVFDFDPVKFQDVVTLPGGYQLTEIAPYVPLGQDISAGQHWQGLPVTLLLAGYGYGKQQFQMEARVVGRESVRVPAGTFQAVRVEATGQKSMGSDRVKVICNYWYGTDSMRAVKMSLEVKYSNPSFTPIPESYELVSFEAGR